MSVTVIRPNWLALSLALFIAATPTVAGADTASEPKGNGPPATETGGVGPGDASYYFDASALAIYGALGGFTAVSLLMEPPDEPLFFSPDEGGAEFRGDTFPNWTIALFSAPALGVILAGDTKSRWYHTKGALGAFAATVFLTELTKNVVGRHRPDYQPGHPEAGLPDGRKSFFSGHSSLTVVSTTYLAWYLGKELFPSLRKPGGGMRWWEPLSYLGIAGVTVGVPLSRVIDNRHNPSDIIVGSLVGAAIATGYFFWHQSSARGAGATEDATRLAEPAGKRPRQWLLAPSASPAGVSAVFQF